MVLSPEERKSKYFSSLKEGAVLKGKLIEYVASDIAIVEINGFLVRCTLKQKIAEGKEVELRLEKLDFSGNLVVLKVIS